MVYRDEHLKITDKGQKAVTLLYFFSLFVMQDWFYFLYEISQKPWRNRLLEWSGHLMPYFTQT